MTPYRKMTIWENRRAAQAIVEFGDLLVAYFEDTKKTTYGVNRLEGPEARRIRSEINRVMGRAHAAIRATGTPTEIVYRAPAMLGGYTQELNLITDLFELDRFMVPPRAVLDQVERALAAYEDDRVPSIRRTFNPFFWLGRGLDWLAGLPFALLGSLGLPAGRWQRSALGRLVAGVVKLVTVLASALTIVNHLGYIDVVRAAVNHLLALLNVGQP